MYATAGVYTVSLTVSNELGSDTQTKNDYIRVADRDGALPNVNGLRRTDKK